MTQEKIEEVARRRGFFWKGSEIYGGLSGFYDYAHLGSAIKIKWENEWRKFFLSLDDNFFEIQPANIMHEKVFIASGHVDSFVDPVVKCKKCGNFERADQILEHHLKENFEGIEPKELENLIKKHDIKCPKCEGKFEEVGSFNLLFPLTVGAENPQKAYPRGETAQGVYVNFAREFECLRKKLPMGLAIVGKAYRNEISPRNLLLRMREFTQAELQIFFDPEKIEEHPKFEEVRTEKLRVLFVKNKESKEITAEELTNRLPQFYVYHMAKVQKFFLEVMKFPKEKFRFKELSEEERAFYNKYHWDVELELSNGFTEVGGVHYRTDHDLSGHQKVSKEDMSVFTDKKILPHVLELSFGVDRNVLALLELNYREDERNFFTFPRNVSPFHCAVFPLVKKDGLDELATEIKELLKENLSVFYDNSGSIGRRYRRMDEIGVPLCLTVDHKSLEDKTVTLRDRDSMAQVRVKISDLEDFMRRFFKGEDLQNLGVIVK